MRPSVIGLLANLIPLVALAHEHEMKVIVDFSEPDGVQWIIVNDGVMGGLSTSDLELTEESTGLFSGFVSLDNNGGFASIRATFQPMDLSPYRGVTLKVRGDGRRYQLRFRLDGSFDGVAYTTEFDTSPGEWMEIHLPFQAFQPTFRGRVPQGAGPLDLTRIRQMSFLIGDKKEGPFRLEIAWVRTLDQEGPQTNRDG